MPADLVAVLRVGVKRSAVPPFRLLMQKTFHLQVFKPLKAETFKWKRCLSGI